MIHIGISGSIGAGKSTLAKNLKDIAESQGFSTAIIPFATGVREVVALETNSMRVFMMHMLFSKWGFDATKAQLAAIAADAAMIEYPSLLGIKNRRLLQIIGTEIGRTLLGEDVWIYRVQQLAKELKFVDFLISDDLRFDNEALAVDVHVHIADNECYQERKKQLDPSYTYSNHTSEQSLTLPPLLIIPACFTTNDVLQLFMLLNKIRMLRS